MLQEAFGREFIDYFATLKEFEINRFLSGVTAWEQREYLELLRSHTGRVSIYQISGISIRGLRLPWAGPGARVR